MQDKSWLRLLDGGELPAVGMAQHEERKEQLLAGDPHCEGLAKPSKSLQNERGLVFYDSVKNSLRGSFLCLTSIYIFRIRCRSEVQQR